MLVSSIVKLKFAL